MKMLSAVSDRAVQVALLFVLTIGMSVAFILAGHPFLPAKYSYDEEKIAALAREEPGVAADHSFQIVGDIYRFVGLAETPLLAGVLGFLAFVLVISVSNRHSGRSTLSPVRIGLVAVVIFLGAVYLGHYAKELFILPICLIVALRVRGWAWDGVVLVSMLAYAMFFRGYWVIVSVFYIMFRLLLLKYSPRRSFLFGSILGLAILSVAFSMALGLDLDHYRLMVNDSRVDNVDAQSAILPLTTMGGVIGGLINALAVLGSFFVPVPLLIKGQVFYLLIVLFCVALWFLVFSTTSRLWKAQGSKRPEWVGRALALLFAFTVVQSIFEPDYGSYIRHLSPLFPLMLSILLLPMPDPMPFARGWASEETQKIVAPAIVRGRSFARRRR